jgi:hypothetical protein
LTQERTENIVSVINRKTLSRARRTSYRDTSRTSCSDERRIKAHREHSIIEERTSLASVTKRSLVTKRFLEENQRFISYNIFDHRFMSLLRARDDMRKKNSFVCKISKTIIWSLEWWTWWNFICKFQKWWSDHLNREFDENFSSSSLFKWSDNRFWNFVYKWNFFFSCHHVHVKTTLNDDRRYYKKRDDDRWKWSTSDVNVWFSLSKRKCFRSFRSHNSFFARSCV